MESVFTFDGDAIVPGPSARAQWYEDALHGGPVAALFARGVERVESPLPMSVVRLTVDLMRPVPAKPLHLDTRVVRDGKRVQVLSALLREGDTEVAMATALRLRTADVPIPDHPRRNAPSFPADLEPTLLGPPDETWFHTTAIEMRSPSGGFEVTGPGEAWVRLTVPLFEGENPTPLQRVAAASDFGNGVGRVLDWSYVFMNADLSIHLHRQPEGEWICLRSRSDIDDRGAGMAQSELFDEKGAIGHALQMLYVDKVEAFRS